MTRPLRIAVLISGGGTTLRNLLDHRQQDDLPYDCRSVISSNPHSQGLVIAREAGIPAVTIRKRDFSDGEQHSQAVFGHCRDAGVELVVMGGYLEHLLIPDDFENRVINIHPSLIPSFSGKGFYGLRVHRAVLEYGAKLSGCTVHFVDNEFDHGPIIAQRSCRVLDDDTPETLQRRVFELECELYPQVVTAIARGQISVHDRRFNSPPT